MKMKYRTKTWLSKVRVKSLSDSVTVCLTVVLFCRFFLCRQLERLRKLTRYNNIHVMYVLVQYMYVDLIKAPFFGLHNCQHFIFAFVYFQY